jgi:hypothetical protein
MAEGHPPLNRKPARPGAEQAPSVHTAVRLQSEGRQLRARHSGALGVKSRSGSTRIRPFSDETGVSGPALNSRKEPRTKAEGQPSPAATVPRTLLGRGRTASADRTARR